MLYLFLCLTKEKLFATCKLNRDTYTSTYAVVNRTLFQFSIKPYRQPKNFPIDFCHVSTEQPNGIPFRLHRKYCCVSKANWKSLENIASSTHIHIGLKKVRTQTHRFCVIFWRFFLRTSTFAKWKICAICVLNTETAVG